MRGGMCQLLHTSTQVGFFSVFSLAFYSYAWWYFGSPGYHFETDSTVPVVVCVWGVCVYMGVSVHTRITHDHHARLAPHTQVENAADGQGGSATAMMLSWLGSAGCEQRPAVKAHSQ